MKKCSRCLEVKELTEFNKRSISKDGLQSKCKACSKIYRLENAEHLQQYKKLYREAYPEYQKEYYKANYDRLKEYRKQYYHNNVEAISEQRKPYHKQYRESLKDGHHHVYILPDHHYAGTTERIVQRMHEHKSRHGRNTDNYEIVGSYEKREDARAHESRLHDEGYNGRHAFNAYK
jgi:hypothetical protein